MAKTFSLEILTPERQFYQDEVEAVTVILPDGELTVLADHASMVASLSMGTIRVKKDGVWRLAASGYGFMEVMLDQVSIFVAACEWPEEIDEHRAEEALHRAEERLGQQRSIIEHRHAQISMARALNRLSVFRRQNPRM